MSAETELPFCSVIVPTYRRAGQLAQCLEALADLDYPRDRLEAIVVNDGGKEPLDDAVAAVAGRLDVTLLRQENAGPSAARNLGAARARGELLAFTDDDCRPAPDWLLRLSRVQASGPPVIVGGHTINALEHNLYAETSQLIIDAGYRRHNSTRDQAGFFTTNNLALPAVALREVGWFEPRLWTSEDRDLCDRWISRGGTMRYVPEAVVFHRHLLTFRKFCRQHFRYGRGAYLFHRLHAQREAERIQLEPSFYLGLHGDAFRRYSLGRALAIQGLLVVWHATNAVGYFWEAAFGTRPSQEHAGTDEQRSAGPSGPHA